MTPHYTITVLAAYESHIGWIDDSSARHSDDIEAAFFGSTTIPYRHNPSPQDRRRLNETVSGKPAFALGTAMLYVHDKEKPRVFITDSQS
jgi:hypothetical protein